MSSFKFFLPFIVCFTHVSAVANQEPIDPRKSIEPPPVVAQAANPVMQQGDRILLNGKTYQVAWLQWQEGETLRTGISDTGAATIFGLELLNTSQSQIQPIQWFSARAELKTRLVNPYRYLDVTDFIRQTGAILTTEGNILKLDSTAVQIKNIAVTMQPWGAQIVVDLDRPAFWQLSQGNKDGVMTFEGIASSELLQRFAPPPPQEQPTPTEEESEDFGGNDRSPKKEAAPPPPLIVENAGLQTKLTINIPDGKRLRASSAANRLTIEVRSDAMVSKNILWSPGIRWKQEYVSLSNPKTKKNDLFPVVFLEIEPKTANISLLPITTNPDNLVGTAPLITTANSVRAIAAINGGFFNRNNKLPLGAIRRGGSWLSSPILNRGAIAWDDRGNFQVARLTLQESLTTSDGQTLPILFLNSGYVQPGIARYTSEWGTSYTPLANNETIIVVENNQVSQQFSGGIAGSASFPIPANGYLLTIRYPTSDSTEAESNLTNFDFAMANKLTVGTQISLKSSTYPGNFVNYPNIVAAGPVLLQNSKVIVDGEAEGFSKAFNQQAASRSAIAKTNKGTLIIAAAHNRAGGRGPTLKEFAQILQRLGVTDALNLDGGSSTSLYLGGQLIDRSPVTAAKVHNGIGIFLLRSPSK
jgi:exopolysaccharide biosynthesis protein